MRHITVAREGRPDFGSIGAAIASIDPAEGGRVVVRVMSGTYREKIDLRVPGLRIAGEGPGSTRLVYGDCASRALPDGRPMGTFNSFTLRVAAPDVRVEGLCVENDAGDGRAVGQAVALYADADRLSFSDCRILACQDSLCTGPLPRDPAPKGVNPLYAFAGYGEEPVPRAQRQYYERCLVRGDVDFIFGGAAAVFSDCEISSRDRGEAVNGFVTAASTCPGEAHGFVFLGCRLTGDAGPGTVYLGRPWRDFARTVFVDCWMGPHVKAEGWHDWDKPAARDACFYAELGSTGPGADPAARVPWARPLSEADRASLSPRAVLAGEDGWDQLGAGACP